MYVEYVFICTNKLPQQLFLLSASTLTLLNFPNRRATGIFEGLDLLTKSLTTYVLYLYALKSFG